MSRAHRHHGGRFLLFLALALLACATPDLLQPPGQPATRSAFAPTAIAGATPRGAATAATAPFTGEPVAGAAERVAAVNPFAPFRAASGSTTLDPALPRADLQDMEKLEALRQLSVEQQETLLTHGFVIDPRPFSSSAAVYAYGAAEKLPAFITADVILHAVALITDVAWQRSQERYLSSDLRALCHNMVVVSENQWEQAQDDAVAQAALHNMAFFAVASALIDPDFTPPSPVADVVAEELTLIAQGGRFISPLFGLEEDYSRFRPPSHYAQSEGLSHYFRALTWLGRPFSFSFTPSGNDALQPLAEARSSARQALLMAWGLNESNNFTRWQRVAEPAYYFEGGAAAGDRAAESATVSWTITQVHIVSSIVYGSGPSLATLATDPLVDDFLATVHTMPSSTGIHPNARPAFAFLPAPDVANEAVPDAVVLRQLTYNRVGAHTGGNALPRTAVQTAIGSIRGLPRTLDVASALGSSLAQSQVVTSGDAAFEGFDVQLQQLQRHYAALEAATWTATYDGAWLFSLQPLLTPSVQDGFLYAPPDSWQMRQLAAWQAAWLELRHTAELAPRPVAAITISPEVAHGYLEPQPLLYGRLAALATQVLDGLASRDLLDEESAAKLGQLERLLDAARVISRKQLAGQRLSADEALLLSQFVTRLQNLTTYEPAPGSAVPQVESGLPRLVDVYLEPSSGRLLQAAAGEAWPIYVLVPREEGIILTLGAVHSSYELHGEQLSPTAWRELEQRPPPPYWLQPFIVRGALDN